ncbi:MAG: 2-isopropylmalate synthase [Gammaproteobacteria bacterium]
MPSFDHTKYQAVSAVAMPNRQWPNNAIDKAPIWASVDLRDGNQALLEPMNVSQKQKFWALLVKLGFKDIEVGFPSASAPDYNFVRWLIEENKIPDNVTIQALVQAREDLIVKTFKALKGAKKAIVHVYNSTSTVQRERVFGMDKDSIKNIACTGAKLLKREAQKYPDTEWTFQYSPESFTGTEMDYAVDVCNAVIDIWQPGTESPCIINLPSTVESTTPNIFADQVEYFSTKINKRDSIILSVHTHNDRGCAVAASELALLAGADRVEGCLLGNGERTGNLDIITMAMNLYSQGIDPELDISNPDEIISVVTECTKIPVHPRHPWVGEMVYTAFSGSHQDAIRKCLHQQSDNEHWQVAYLPINPEDLGRDYQAVIRVNSQSGKGGVAFVMERDYGIILPRWIQVELAQLVQQHSEHHSGEIDSATIYGIFTNHFIVDSNPNSLQSYQIKRINNHDEIQITLSDNNTIVTIDGSGEGALSAVVDACKKYFGIQINVTDYSEHALGEGTDVQAIAFISLNIDGQRVSGVAMDYDTISASIKAMISALNRFQLKHIKAA